MFQNPNKSLTNISKFSRAENDDGNSLMELPVKRRAVKLCSWHKHKGNSSNRLSSSQIDVKVPSRPS